MRTLISRLKRSAPGRDPALEGVPLLDLLHIEEPATSDDLSACRVMFEGDVRDGVVDGGIFEPAHDDLWDALEQRVLDHGWSRQLLLSVAVYLVETMRFVRRGDTLPRWTIGDWFSAPMVRVYGRAWYLQRGSDERAKIGAYRCPGLGVVYGWRHELDNELEPITHAPATSGMPEVSSGPATKRERKKVVRLAAATKEILALRSSVADLETKVEMLQRRIIHDGLAEQAAVAADERVRDLQMKVQGYEAEIRDLRQAYTQTLAQLRKVTDERDKLRKQTKRR